MSRQINNQTKLTLLVVLFTFLCLTAISQQESAIKKFYVSAGVGAASSKGWGSSFEAHFMLKKNWTASLSFQHAEIDAKNIPDDYVPEYSVLLFFPMGGTFPTDHLKSLNFTAGKYCELGRRTWVTAEAGVSIVTGEVYKYSRQEISQTYYLIGYYSSSNYFLSAEKETSIGGVLKTDFHWAFLPWVGLGAGLYANLNGHQAYAGGQFTITAGWMNLKKKAKGKSEKAKN